MKLLSAARRFWRGDLSRTLAIALVTAGAGMLVATEGSTPLQRLERIWLDTLVRTSAAADRPRPGHTIVIDVDDVSLSAVGQWPWPRYRVAAMIERVAAAAPRAIALDIVFPEADRSSLSSIRQTFRKDFGLDLAFSGVPEGLQDNDGFLGDVMARSNAVAAHYFYFDHSSPVEAPLRTGVRFQGRTDALQLPEPTGMLANAGPIAAQTRTSGFMNSGADSDGVVRRVPLMLRYNGALHPSLALAATMRALGVDTATIEHGWQGSSLRLGEHVVPIANDGTLLLRFDGPGPRYASVSAIDVLNGRVRDSDFAGKLVFIGSSAVGTNDLHLTAVDPRFPGLKIQSVVAENLLHGTAIAQPAWARWIVAVLCLTTAFFMSVVFLRHRGMLPVLASAGVVILAGVGLSAGLFLELRIWLSPLAPVAVAGALFTALFSHRFIAERGRADAARRQLENARQVTIESMAAVAETRDPETGAHIKRTQHYVRAIAEQMRQRGLHRQTLTPAYIHLLFLSAPLHDIGKVGVPDRILLKPGKLTDEEMTSMKEHAEYGRKIVLSTAQRIDGDNFLVVASEIAATHHEKWDGTGYPRGLAGEAIPLAGRIMAVADVYDALISRRCYKEPFTHTHSTALMREMRGRNFDPEVLDAFFAIEQEILEIAQRFKDEEPEDAHDPSGAAAQEAKEERPHWMPPLHTDRTPTPSKRSDAAAQHEKDQKAHAAH